jgi:uncharacterized protein YkwD
MRGSDEFAGRMESVKRVTLWLSLVAALHAPAAEQIISRPRPGAAAEAAALFTRYNSSSFAALPSARQIINPNAVNYDVLEAAVFHETNRRRQQQRLPALKHDEKARAAAKMQSRDMAKGAFVGHENPDPAKKTMSDRATLAGLSPQVLAENVASAFGRRYKSGQSFCTREVNGRKIYSYEPDGPAIPLHTYLSFAEALVDSWMKSPGHRKNILHTEVQYLGCACELPRNPNAMETFYCTQVFFTPLDLDPR